MPDSCSGPKAGWAKDAHKVDFVEVHYIFHPYFGQRLKVKRIFKEELIVVSPEGRRLRGIPLWMTDKEAYKQIKISPRPYCSCDALRNLRELLSHIGEES